MNQVRGETHRVAGQVIWHEWLALAVLVGVVVGLVGALGWESTQSAPSTPQRHLLAVSHWFDPIFFQYNLVLLAVTVLVVPFVALSYVHTMMRRKERRLHRELPEHRRGEIGERLRSRIAFSSYLGSVSLTMLIVLLGAAIILLFKPVPSPDQRGVDFSLGANFLMVGPFIDLLQTEPHAYYVHLMRSLTAFQFGFLGAYIYFIGMLVRAYFTLDLTPQTFVDGSFRMISSSVLALIISFVPWIHGTVDISSTSASTAAIQSARLADSQLAVSDRATPATTSQDKPSENASSSEPERSESGNQPPTQATWSVSLLPIVSFVFGFFPKWAMLGLQYTTLKVLRRFIPEQNTTDQYRALPLSLLAGMSYMHEARLEREGFDNIENFSTADPVSLAVSTGFTYPQLAQWISIAWLVTHLREDYPKFVQHTGITSRDELVLFLTRWDGSLAHAVDQLTKDASSSQAMKVKLTVLGTLLCPAKQ
ncbi:hypothetical protein ACO9S2_12775 [Nitrospira sp. NS4]|uniref:hypothetical protein n=1 Tax=Nitrospira sp. NS4 TaxID=3414498 RepID=UPI003C2C14E8